MTQSIFFLLELPLCNYLQTKQTIMQSSTSTTTIHHPLHLLDDLLISITTTSSNCKHTQNSNDIDDTKDTNNNIEEDDNTILLLAETNQDLVLHAANELFGNNMSLLENALALLDEQEQYQNNNMEIDASVNTTPPLPVIRRIRAKRSGRTAILVRKTRKKSSYKSKSTTKNSTSPSHQVHSNTNEEKKQSVASTTDEYYLCLMGREKIDRRAVMNNNNNDRSSSGVWCKVQRQGAHCTCRSFSQNIKGGNNRSSSSPKRNNDSSTQLVVNSNAVVCKHLLAAILLPHMLPWSKPGCELEDEIVDDREFAKLISKASIG